MFLGSTVHNMKEIVNKQLSEMNEMDVKDLWRNADCVCFDVDSTICNHEAIDDLASFCGVGDKVQELTVQAMGGNLSFREALKLRLGIIKPSRQTIDEFNKTQHSKLTEGAKELVDKLKGRGIPVYLVSGGFRLIINPVADQLEISRENVYANTLLFKSCGAYDGFDENELTSASGGKGKVIGLLKSKFYYKNVIMVGDGVTDLETCPPADGFIGFGGNVVREAVKKNSPWFVTSFHELINELD